MSTPLRILTVSHFYAEHRGGVEIVAGKLAAGLAQAGMSVTWAASACPACLTPGGFATLPMRACNIAETRLGIPYPIWSPGSLIRLVQAVRESDVVHLHDCLYAGNVIAYLAARLFRKPVVVTQHIGLVPYSQPGLRTAMKLANRLLGGLVLGGCAQAIFVSRQVEQYFRQRISLSPLPCLVPNGVDHAQFYPIDAEARRRLRASLNWDDNRPVMLFVGRFVEKKGLPLLRRLAERFPACRWAFAGWGPENPDTWGLQNVLCLGAVNHERLADYYRAADWLVLPSAGEGFPLVVQEAMACGTPAVISDDTARGCPGVERVLPVCKLTSTAWAEQIQRLLNATEDWDSQRRRAAEFAQDTWNWERCIESYAELFGRLVRNPSGRKAIDPATQRSTIAAAETLDRQTRNATT
jgi:glycosyltransferase involved in cell wall biosynthesis